MPRKHPLRRGSVLVLSAFLMVASLLMVAFAVDIGFIVVLRTELQAAADAGALAGCGALRHGPATAKNEAKSFADLNLASTNPDVSVVTAEDVQLGVWDPKTLTFQPVTGMDEYIANAVRVTCRMSAARNNAAPLFFGLMAGRSVTEQEASAIARARSLECGKFIGVTRVTMSGWTYTDSYYSDAGPYDAASASNNGDVCSNGPILLGHYTSVDGDATPGVGSSVMGAGAVSGSSAPLSEPLRIAPIDMGTAPVTNDNGNIPLSTMGVNPLLPNGQFYLAPGDSVTLPEGIYYFTRLTLVNATLTFTGRTVIFVDGDLSANGGAILNLTEVPSNLQLYCTGTSCTLTGSTDFHGVVYAPQARVSLSGPANFFGLMLGRELVLSGTAGLHADDSLGTLYGVNTRSILVE